MSSPPRLATALLLGATLTTLTAGAQPAPAAPSPYSAWDGQSPLPSPPPVLDEAPSPLEREPEWGRRSVELVPEVGFALPRCVAQRSRNSTCATFSGGRIFGFYALYRPTPYFAFGGGALLTEFEGDAGSTRTVELGALARVYLLESGRVEPYLELWLGGGSQSSRVTAAPKLNHDASSAGLRVGGGVDFYLAEHVRLGPSLGAAQLFAVHGAPELAGAYFASARLSLAFGSRH